MARNDSRKLTLLLTVSRLVVFLLQAVAPCSGHISPSHVAMTSYEHRTRRDLDEEDVVNRFEMERVSPLYDIIRHLPPFDDGWLQDPPAPPSFPAVPPPPSFPMSSSNGTAAFKVKLSTDSGHVVSESGRKFHQNSALNWFYAAEAYSSSDTKNSWPSIPEVPRGPARKLDEDHVVSHGPGLRGGRGALVQHFSLLGSATTPGTTETTPKPNVTTRYILLQSGRVVAINVTSTPTAVSRPGSSNLPAPFFGSRIRNKNASKPPASSSDNPPKLLLAGKEGKPAPPTKKPQSPFSPNKNPTKASYPATKLPASTTTIRPHVVTVVKAATTQRHFQPLLPTSSTARPPSDSLSSIDRAEVIGQKHAMTTDAPHVTTGHESNARSGDKPEVAAPHVIYVKSKSSPQPLEEPTTEFMPSLEEALRWWSEMREKNGREPTVEYARTTNTPPPNIFQTLADVLQAPTEKAASANKSSEPKKKQQSNGDSETPKPVRSPKQNVLTSERVKQPKKGKPNSSPWSISPTNASASATDGLELSSPGPDRRYDFARLVTLQPPSTTSPTTPFPPSTAKSIKSSRRPRYRGLSHVNLQSPVKPSTGTAAGPAGHPATHRAPQQLGASANPLPPVQHLAGPKPAQGPAKDKPQAATTPSRRSRNGFHLRNSISFQTSPPGSLTDRRTLTSAPPVTTGQPGEDSLSPPLEDLLFIRFEPTRKSARNDEFEELKEIDLQPEVKAKRPPAPTKKTSIVASRTPPSKATPRPSVRPKSEGTTPGTTNIRRGRNFRITAPKSQDLEAEEKTTDVVKEPVRVYYFEPKRKKPKNLEHAVKSDHVTSSAPEVASSARHHNQPSRRPNYKQFNPRPLTRPTKESSRGRQPKQLQQPQPAAERRQPQPTTSTTTSTSKPVVRKAKSSPFIWHRPNVGKFKPKKDVLSEVATPEQSSSTTSPIKRRYDDGFYHPQGR